jgi:hypothetical protein
MVRRIGLLLVFVLAGMLSGCYELPGEVVPADQGEALPYVYNYAVMDDGGRMDFTKSTSNNDYRFQWTQKDGTKKTGTFRAIRIKDDIYAFQARYDDDSDYNVVFYRVDPNRFDPVDPVPGSDFKGLASQYSVTLEYDDMADDNNSWDAKGSPSAILAFLRAHKQFDFSHKAD